MTKKPNFQSMSMGNTELPKGFFRVLTVSSDGQSVSIDIPEWIIPFLNDQILQGSKACIEDAFYRLRPDLRKQ